VADGGWWLADRLGVLAVVLATNVVLVRALGPAGFGELSYLLALVALLLPVAQLGVSGLVARALLEWPDAAREILGTALWLRLAGAVAAFVIGAIVWLAYEGAARERALLLVLLAAQPVAAYQVLESWFQVQLRARELVAWRSAAVLLAAAAKVGTALATGSVGAVVLVYASEYALIGLAHAVAWRRAGGGWVLPRPVTRWIRWFATRAPWLFASGIAEVVYLKIDVVMLERMRGLEETGIYAVAARLSEAWYAVAVVLMAAAFPALWARRSDPAAYERGLQAAFDGMFVLGFAVAVVMQVAAVPLVAVLFGPRFEAAAPVLALHVWAGVFVFMRAVVSRWLLAEDLLRFSLWTYLAGGAVNVGLNLLLIPRYGATGAALATVAAAAVAGWGSLWFSARTRPLARMMGRSLLLPFRWRDVAGYWRRARTAA
jgi:PST family polysaccharide transporter